MAETSRQPLDLQKLTNTVVAKTQQHGRPLVVQEVQQAIPAGAALVEFAVYRAFDPWAKTAGQQWGPRRYAAYVLHPQGEPVSVDLGDAAAIERSVAELRRGLSLPASSALPVLRAARTLDEQVMRPIREHLGEARHVFLSPEGGCTSFRSARCATRPIAISSSAIPSLTSQRAAICCASLRARVRGRVRWFSPTRISDRRQVSPSRPCRRPLLLRRAPSISPGWNSKACRTPRTKRRRSRRFFPPPTSSRVATRRKRR